MKLLAMKGLVGEDKASAGFLRQKLVHSQR